MKTRSSSTSDLPKKVICPERTLALPPGIDADEYEVLCVQLDTVRPNSVCAIDLIKSLIDAVNKLSDDVTQVKSDNLALKNQIQVLQDSAYDHSRPPRQQPHGSLYQRPASKPQKQAVNLCNGAAR
jgi:hypothetical protein